MNYQNVNLHTIADTIVEDDKPGFTVSRLPTAILPDINKNAQKMALLSGNAEIRGMLKPGGKATIVLECLDNNVVPPIVNVFFGSYRYKQILLQHEPTEIVIEVPQKMELMTKIHAESQMRFDPWLIRVCLPAIHPVRVVSIDGDLSLPTADALPEKTLLCYGSSITHGAHAIAPESTYAAQCAYNLGYDLINLGLGGSAHMDAPIADFIAARDDWDVATFEMGINVRMWEPEKFRAAVDNFVTTVVKANPDKPIFCIDLFTNDFDFMEDPPGAIGFREIVDDIVRKQNSDKVFHIDGRSILTNPAGLQADLVHPSDNGMIEMGRNLADIIKTQLKG